jgi:curved DNA-binding protein
MDVKDYYATLGVPRAATQAEIKKAFRKLAREYHPDKRPGDTAAERRFKELNEANEVLSDPAKREKYDRFGQDWEAYERAGAAAGGGGAFAGNPFGPGGPFAQYASAAGHGGVRYEFRTAGDGDFSDFFQMLFGADGAAGTAGRGGGAAGAGARAGGLGGFGDLFAGMGGTGGARGGRAPRVPVEAEATLSLEEAFHGTTRIVEAGGRRLEVTIPRGVDTGSRVKLSGKGPDGRDLVVVVRVRPHAVFARRGADLEREIPVTLEEALLGGQVVIPTLKGRVALTVPAGTQNGRTFRLAGQGMPRLKGDGAGDLFVRARVVLPVDLDPEARDAARRFLDLAAQPDPRA